MSIAIRSAQVEDYPSLAKIYFACRRDDFPWADPVGDTLADFTAQIRGEAVYVAEVQGELAGFVSVWEPDSFVHHLYVAAAHRKRGIGSALLAALESSLPRPYRLKCAEANTTALAFYAKQGWREVGPGHGEEGPYLLLEKV